MKRYLYINLLLCFFTSIKAQQRIDGFSSGNTDNWNKTGETFNYQLESNILKISYNRTATSGAWDQFNLKVADLALSNYELKIRIKADFNFQFTAKPVYSDNTYDWLQKNVTAGDQFTDVTFQISSNAARTLQTIYFYFDGGSTTVKSGNAWIESVSINALLTQRLKKVIQNAKLLHDKSATGTAPGNFPEAGKTEFQQAIAQAEGVVANTSSTQAQIDQAVVNLDKAMIAFESKEVTETAVSQMNVADLKATRRTKILYANLKFNAGKKMLFGHQDATGYGVGWTNDDDRSDVKDVTGSYPALGAWGVAGISTGQDYSRDKYRVEKFYKLGGVNTFEWHCGDPYEGKFYQADLTKGRNIVADILPGGPKHDWFKAQLKNLAVYFKDLKGENGESVPVIFRPWHEHTDNWFWWGTGNCTKEQYIDLWKFTKVYLNDSCQVHNLLFAYSPDRFSTKTAYLERWPGDEVIDILGFDDYWDLRYNNTDMAAFTNSLTLLGEMAEEKGKVCALTEAGQEKIESSNWFTQTLLKGILTNDKTKKVAYACVWRNASTTHFYAPYPGHPAVNDFISFYNHDYTVFMSDVPELYESVQSNTTQISMNPDKLTQVKFFPNPTSGLVKFSGIENNSKVEIYNTQGQLILQKQNVSIIDLSPFKDGVYLLRMNYKGEEINQKVLLCRN